MSGCTASNRARAPIHRHPNDMAYTPLQRAGGAANKGAHVICLTRAVKALSYYFV